MSNFTEQYVQAMLAERNGLFLVTVYGSRIVSLSRCRVAPPVLPESVLALQSAQLVQQMLQQRNGLFLVSVAGGAVVHVASIDSPLRIAPKS